MYNPEIGHDPYNEKFSTLGFDTKVFFYNLGDISVLQFYVVYLVIKLLIQKIGCCK
jgi:hypothetical protein